MVVFTRTAQDQTSQALPYTEELLTITAGRDHSFILIWLNRICVDCTFLWLIKDLRAAASWE
ncbi:hypothetical protein ACRRTK_012760 [Alexandromys fortis]